MMETTIDARALARAACRGTATLLATATLWIGAANATECPDANGLASGVSLNAQQIAGSPRDFSARYVAGDLTYDSCPDIIRRGYFFRNPSVTLSLSGTRPGWSLSLNLRFSGESYCDPVVLVSTPDGQWFEDDDSGEGLEALLSVPASRDGVYRVWLGHYRAGETCEGTLRVGYTLGGGPLTPTVSLWQSITPDQRQNAAQPGGVTPLRNTRFAAGTYDIYTADAGPNGLGPRTRIQRHTETLLSNQLYVVDLGGGADNYAFGSNNALTNHYGDPGEGQATIYVHNTNPSRWRAICVVPTGTPIAQCGADETSFAPWWPITNNQGQFIGQPGRVSPVPVNPGPYFVSGQYNIYLADALNHGTGPFVNVVRYSAILRPNHRYSLDLGGGTDSTLRMGEETPDVLRYSEPGEGHAAIYARNSNTDGWRAVCVLPVGMDYSHCGGGGQTVYSEWTAVTNDQRQFSGQPAGVYPLMTCDRSTQSRASDFPVGMYDIYVGNAGDRGYQPYTDLHRFTVTLETNRNYAVDLGSVNGFSISDRAAGMNQYGAPLDGYARIYVQNSNINSWRAICVLPSGWDRRWCEIGTPYPCAGGH